MEAKSSILLVDDEPDFLQTLSLALELADFQPFTAGDGIEALQVLQIQPIDLIISDIIMPFMNGYQFYRHIRTNPDWALIPFIFLTGCILDSEIRYGKELGVDDYLLKPVQPTDLIAVIRGKLRRVQQFAQHRPQPQSIPKPP